jgi:sarcosine oxidase subunit beta
MTLVNSSSLPKTADVVILGAGVMGTSIAFHLAKRKAGKIVVVDKDHVGRGGSGRSSALVPLPLQFPRGSGTGLDQLAHVSELAGSCGGPGDFRKTGFVRIVHPNETARLKHNVEMQRGLGATVELIDNHQLRELEPDWKVDDVELAAYEPGSGYGDGAGVAGDFLSAARDMGTIYLSRTQATAWHVRDDCVRGVVTDRGAISSPIVIAATGAWTRPLLQQAGYEVPIECEYHQVAILRNAPGMKGGGRACIDSVTATYFRSDAHDKFLVGDFYGKRPVDPDKFPQRASDEWREEIIERACRRVPKLEQAEVTGGVTGVYDMTPDSRPLLGEIPGIRGLFVCAGFSGMGFKISPAIGLVMSELVLDGKARSVDIGPFRPSRFAENAPIRAEYEYVDD